MDPVANADAEAQVAADLAQRKAAKEAEAAEKARLKQEALERKEAERAEKEAKKAEAKAEKERLKAEKEAERAAKKAEREANRAEKKERGPTKKSIVFDLIVSAASTVAEIASHVGVNEQAARSLINDLKRDGKAVKAEKGEDKVMRYSAEPAPAAAE